MKLDEIISNDVILEYEDMSDLASQALNDPAGDMFARQDNMSRKPGQSRKPVISLKHIHKLKLIQAAKIEEFEKRKVLMGLMYAVPQEEEGGGI